MTRAAVAAGVEEKLRVPPAGHNTDSCCSAAQQSAANDGRRAGRDHPTGRISSGKAQQPRSGHGRCAPWTRTHPSTPGPKGHCRVVTSHPLEQHRRPEDMRCMARFPGRPLATAAASLHALPATTAGGTAPVAHGPAPDRKRKPRAMPTIMWLPWNTAPLLATGPGGLKRLLSAAAGPWSQS